MILINGNKTETDSLSLRDLFSPKKVFTVKKMTAMAVLLAVRAILGLPVLTIYISGVKVFTLAHVADALCAVFFGPIAGLIFGFAGDFLGFIAAQGSGGGYMIFYALSEMATCFIFAVFLYRRALTWTRVILSTVLNLAIVFLGLNTLWFTLLYGSEAMSGALPFRIGLNCAITPVYIILIYLLLSRLTRIRGLDRYLK